MGMMQAFDKLLKKMTDWVFKFLHMEISEEKEKSLIQFVKFGLVGLSNTLVSYLLNILILLILSPFQFGKDYIVANIVSFILSIFWSFYWNNKYVFALKDNEKRNIGLALLKSFLSYGFTGFILNNFLSWVWIEVLGISKYIAPMLNLVLSIPINFFMNKKWAFKSIK